MHDYIESPIVNERDNQHHLPDPLSENDIAQILEYRNNKTVAYRNGIKLQILIVAAFIILINSTLVSQKDLTPIVGIGHILLSSLISAAFAFSIAISLRAIPVVIALMFLISAYYGINTAAYVSVITTVYAALFFGVCPIVESIINKLLGLPEDTSLTGGLNRFDRMEREELLRKRLQWMSERNDQIKQFNTKLLALGRPIIWDDMMQIRSRFYELENEQIAIENITNITP